MFYLLVYLGNGVRFPGSGIIGGCKLGTEVGPSGRTARVLSYEAISAAPLTPFYDGLRTVFASFHLFPHRLAWASLETQACW